ncbi:MAG TPA: UDP-glucose/GDP-mannose dehydrogenase family protein [Candidatus Aquilonibacter sp.]
MIVSIRPKHICIVGTGYVGMASAVGFAELGHRVTGYDIVAERVRGLQRGITPYRETGIEDALRRHLVRDGIRFHVDLEAAVRGADYVVIAVGTPAHADGSADLSAVEDAIASLGPLLAEHAVIVLRSTVPAGTSERLAAGCRNELIYAPEFLREGSALVDFVNPDRIVVGAASTAAAEEYGALLAGLGRPLVITTLRNAELIKAFSNAFLALKISFANEVANFCDVVGADALAVLSGIGHDSRIGRAFLYPGIGFGGPCFEKDLKSLDHVAQQHGTSRELISATLRVNAAQPKRIVDILEHELGGLAGAHVGVWGLAFKAATDDVRDSLALRILNDLCARGAAATAYDPAVRALPPGYRCELAPSALGALENADALLVLTEWPEFGLVSPWAIAAQLRRDVVVDGRNVLDPRAIVAAGLRYRGVGRTASSDHTAVAAAS